MKNKPTTDNEKKVKTSSSISISSQTVCQDEACIGKTVNDASSIEKEPAKASEKRKKPPGSAMSFGGKKGCTDDACIGIK